MAKKKKPKKALTKKVAKRWAQRMDPTGRVQSIIDLMDVQSPTFEVKGKDLFALLVLLGRRRRRR